MTESEEEKKNSDLHPDKTPIKCSIIHQDWYDCLEDQRKDPETLLGCNRILTYYEICATIAKSKYDANFGENHCLKEFDAIKKACMPADEQYVPPSQLFAKGCLDAQKWHTKCITKTGKSEKERMRFMTGRQRTNWKLGES